MVFGMSIEESERRSLEAGRKLAHPEPGEEVVITGCSGRFPDSDDVYQLRDNLYNKVDLISADARRWNLRKFSLTPISSLCGWCSSSSIKMPTDLALRLGPLYHPGFLV